MVIFPFHGVDAIAFGMEVAEGRALVPGGQNHFVDRSGDGEELEHVVVDVDKNGKKAWRIGLHERKGEKGIRAISVFHGPLYLYERPDADLLSLPRGAIRNAVLGARVTPDSQIDNFVDVDISAYFEEPGLDQKPAVILVASHNYWASFLMQGEA